MAKKQRKKNNIAVSLKMRGSSLYGDWGEGELPGKRSATRLKVYACVSSQSSSVYSVAPAVDISINASALSCG